MSGSLNGQGRLGGHGGCGSVVVVVMLALAMLLMLALVVVVMLALVVVQVRALVRRGKVN